MVAACRTGPWEKDAPSSSSHGAAKDLPGHQPAWSLFRNNTRSRESGGLQPPLPSWTQPGLELGGRSQWWAQRWGPAPAPFRLLRAQLKDLTDGLMKMGGVRAMGQVLRKMDRKPGNEFPSGPTMSIKAALLQ